MLAAYITKLCEGKLFFCLKLVFFGNIIAMSAHFTDESQ